MPRPCQTGEGGTAESRRRCWRALGAALLVLSIWVPATPALAAGSLSIGDASVTEGDSGTTTALFTVTLTSPASGTETFDFTTVNGTATGPGDFTPAAGTRMFPSGESSVTIPITVNGDDLAEGPETFAVIISNASGGAVIPAATGTDSGTGTILDDDVKPSISIDDASVTEGGDARFRVSLFPESAQPVTVAFTTANGTAVAPDDYGSEAGLVSFSPGDGEETVTVSTRSDSLSDPGETFTVLLSNPTIADITDAVGIGTILNHDLASTITINDAEVFEGRAARFKVSLFPDSSETVTVAFTTANGTAVAPDDYDNQAGRLTFSPGEASETITVDTRGDGEVEDLETFAVLLSNATNATISDTSGIATVLDGDVSPSLTIDDVEVVEGDSDSTNAVFTVTLFPASKERVTVEFATANGTAISPEDYRNKAGLLSFSPGETTKQVVVKVTADEVDEVPRAQRSVSFGGGGTVVTDSSNLSESFTVTLLNPVNARFADSQGAGTIIDDDLTPAFSISDVTVTEGDYGTDAVFSVALFPEAGEEAMVEFTTSSANTPTTAVAPTDYRFTAGTLRFAPGERIRTIRVEVQGDVLDEPDEQFVVILSNPTGARIADGEGVATIVDDELGPALRVNDVTVVEGDSGEAEAVFSVSLTEPSNRIVTVEVLTADDLALTPGDYIAVRGVLSLAPGATTLSVRVPVVGDVLEEPDETFFVRIFNASIAIADNEGVGIIVDDDAPAAPRVALVPTPTAKGYWLVASDGDVFVFGDAPFLGSLGPGSARGARPRPARPVVGMATTTTGRGYWLVASDGGIFAFGNARFLGSTGDIRLSQPIVGMAPTPSGLGYWLVASDGGVFAFGDARFFGSTGGRPLNRPIVGMAPTPSGLGYRLVASDGGVFAFGDAPFLGSTGSIRLLRPIVGMARTPSGLGYWLVASDGGVFAFGDAAFLGSTGGVRPTPPPGTPR